MMYFTPNEPGCLFYIIPLVFVSPFRSPQPSYHPDQVDPYNRGEDKAPEDHYQSQQYSSSTTDLQHYTAQLEERFWQRPPQQQQQKHIGAGPERRGRQQAQFGAAPERDPYQRLQEPYHRPGAGGDLYHHPRMQDPDPRGYYERQPAGNRPQDAHFNDGERRPQERLGKKNPSVVVSFVNRKDYVS